MLKKDSREKVNEILNYTCRSIKRLVLREARELRPFPRMKVGVFLNKTPYYFQKTKEVMGLLICEEDAEEYPGIKYIVLHPSGLRRYEGVVNPNVLKEGIFSSPGSLPKYGRYKIMEVEDYLRYYELIFEKIEKCKGERKDHYKEEILVEGVRGNREDFWRFDSV